MNLRNNALVGCLGYLAIYCVPALIIFLITMLAEAIDESDFFNYLHVLLFILLIASIVKAVVMYKKYKNEEKERKHYVQLLNEEREKTKNLNSTLACLRTLNDKLTQLLNSKSPFKDVADLTRDCFSAIFDKEEHYLRYKSRPANR